MCATTRREPAMRIKESVRPLRFQLLLLCAAVVSWAHAARGEDTSGYKVQMQPLPGATAAGVTMDCISCDPATRFVWAPAGNTGLFVVIDSTTGSVKQIAGFPTAEMGSGERKR